MQAVSRVVVPLGGIFARNVKSRLRPSGGLKPTLRGALTGMPGGLVPAIRRSGGQ